VSKKNLYCYARLVVLNYEIGYVENNKYYQEIKKKLIVKPHCINISNSTEYHGITQEYALNNGINCDKIIEEFKNDIKDVNVLVSHNIDFHLKTLLAEIVRYNIPFSLTSYIIIDTISFYHNYDYPKLKDLAVKLTVKNIDDKDNLELIRDVFFKLYHKFEKSIKK